MNHLQSGRGLQTPYFKNASRPLKDTIPGTSHYFNCPLFFFLLSRYNERLSSKKNCNVLTSPRFFGRAKTAPSKFDCPNECLTEWAWSSNAYFSDEISPIYKTQFRTLPIISGVRCFSLCCCAEAIVEF
jgi:hypothetical protein